jgi:hypothetical protein
MFKMLGILVSKTCNADSSFTCFSSRYVDRPRPNDLHRGLLQRSTVKEIEVSKIADEMPFLANLKKYAVEDFFQEMSVNADWCLFEAAASRGIHTNGSGRRKRRHRIGEGGERLRLVFCEGTLFDEVIIKFIQDRYEDTFWNELGDGHRGIGG